MTVTRHQAVGAFQPWQPPTFDDNGQLIESGAADTDPLGEDATAETVDFKLPTADDIEQMYEQAREEGRQAGHAAGYTAGYEEGRAAASTEAGQLHAIAQDLQQSLTALDDEVAQEVVGLAIAIARQIVGHAVRTQPDAVLHVVREALLQLPHNKARVHVHPEDVAILRKHLGEQLEQGHHLLLEDPTVRRGGCRLETPSSELDARVETRWRRVIEAMGHPASVWDDEDESE